MNRDQLAIRAAMQGQGWQESTVHEKHAMRLGETLAIIRPNRTVDVLRDTPDRLCYFAYVQAYKGRGWLQLAVSIATAAAKTKLTSDQFSDMLHVIGCRSGGHARPVLGDYYDARDGAKRALSALVESGYIEIRGAEVYRVTPKGAAEVGCAGCLEPK